MNLNKLFITLSFLVIFDITAISGRFESVELAKNWKIIKIEPTANLSPGAIASLSKSDQWIPVNTMPRMIHQVLMENGKMPEPWLPGVAEKFMWVSESDWVYGCTFNTSNPNDISFLYFGGLDCIVDVYLNNECIATNTNVLYPIRVEVTGKLKKVNTLYLHFHTVFETQNDKPAPIKTYKGMQVRRPSQNYLNYLGPYPYFSKYGVYGKVLLETTYGKEITTCMVGSDVDQTLTKGTVTIDIEGVTNESRCEILVNIFDELNNKVASNTTKPIISDNSFRAQINVPVQNPNLWWPRGYGNQNLYKAVTKLIINGKEHQSITKTIGFRRITQPTLLHFEVNNTPIKLWGGDWVSPQWHTLVWDKERAAELIRMAEIANFNTFRVWGVVEAPDDDFYEMCDKKGFLLWQDFTELPLSPDEKSLSVCREEAALLIKRLKNHPSVLLWNGGNENALWHHKEYNGQLLDRGEWPGVKAGIEVAGVVNKLDPNRYFQPTSPWLGIDPNDPREGSTHGYTNMWYVPGYDFLNFAAEDTRIAAPVLHSCKKFMRNEEIFPEGYTTLSLHGNKLPYPESWLKYTTSESWKKTGPVELFYDADNAEQLIYRIGMAEALYYRNTIEQQRRGRPATANSDERRCGGYIVWKYNDSWPQIYSAKVDYFLEPYHAYYALKRAFEPVMLSFEVGTYIWLWAINDSPETVTGKVTIQLFHPMLNQTRATIERQVEVKPGKSLVVVQLDEAGIGSFRREHVLHASLTDENGTMIAETFAPGDIERRTLFPDAKIDITVSEGKLILKSDKYAYNVTLTGNDNGDNFGFLFSDNYFDMMPGVEKTIEILGKKTKGDITVKAWYSDKVSTVAWQKPSDNNQRKLK